MYTFPCRCSTSRYENNKKPIQKHVTAWLGVARGYPRLPGRHTGSDRLREMNVVIY